MRSYSLEGTKDNGHDFRTCFSGATGGGMGAKRAGVAKFTPGMRNRAGAHQPKKTRNQIRRR